MKIMTVWQVSVPSVAALATFTCINPVAHAEVTTEEVVVTAKQLEEGLPQDLAQYGARLNVVTAEQIKNGGYVDVAQSLQTTIPGLYLAPKNGPFDYVDISLQGSRTSDVLWMVDGVRINNRLYGGTTPLDTLPASIVERLEVLEGGQALFYGTQAVAGAVNIVTKAFSDKPDGAVSLGADTNHGRHVDGYFRDAINNHQFVVYGSSDSSSGFRVFRDQDYQPSATDRDRGYKVLTLGAKYAYEFSPDWRLSANYQHTDGKLDYAYANTVAEAFNERNEDLVTAKLDGKLNEVFQLFGKVYYHRWASHYTEFDNNLDTGGLDVIDDHDAWGYKDYGINALAKLKLNKGLEYFLGYDQQNYGGNDAVLVITQHSERTQAVFGQIRTNEDFSSRLKLAAGVRYNKPSVGESATVGNVSGKFDVSDALFFRGLVGRSFRLPTAEELFANDPADERGNPDLKPETSTNLNLSIGGHVNLGEPRLGWELIGFARNIKNLISLDTYDAVTEQDVFGNTPGTVKVRGLELVLDATFSNALSGSLSATHNQSRSDVSDQQLRRIPVNYYQGSLDYHPATAPWGATLTLKRLGKIYDTVATNPESYGDYTVVNVAGRIFVTADRRDQINLAVENVFDKEYATRLGRGYTDADGSAYTVWNRGLPRTLYARYTHSF